jgi:DNA-binding GntR family transcriptional regulator
MTEPAAYRKIVAPLGPDAALLSNLAEGIYRSLVTSIVAGELPPGRKLDEHSVARQFGVSRTPVREALRELAARGLVEILPRKGGVVALPSQERLADLMEAESEIEALCCRLAAQRMNGIERGALQALHEEAAAVAEGGTLEEYFALNHAFHEAICRATGNVTITEAIAGLRLRLSPFRRPPAEKDRERMRRSQADHLAILAAIMESDAERAYAAMRTHNGRVNAAALRVFGCVSS